MPQPTTIGELINLWTASAHDLPAETLRTYREAFESLAPDIASRELKDLRPGYIEATFSNLSPDELAALQHFWLWAYANYC